MNHHYADIKDRIAEEPKWWDEHAVPRYGDFSPEMTANIYAKEAALVFIECQNCGTGFRVCFSSDGMVLTYDGLKQDRLSERVADLHYGDPPNMGCCPAGPTMNSVPRKVLEFWTLDRERNGWEWERRPEFEVAIECEWAE